MSDIDNHSYGRDTSSWAGIRTSLTEVERRLGELQDQLDPQEPTGAGGSLRLSPVLDIGREPVGVGTEMTGSALGASAGGFPTSAAGIGFVPSSFSSNSGASHGASRMADEILAEARAAAHEVLAAAEAQVGLAKEQVEQLLQARETLRRSLRTALDDCESSLARFERGEQPAHSSGAQALLGKLSSLSRPDGRMPTAPPSIASSAVELDGAAVRFVSGGVAPASRMPEVFEGSVSLRVGPLRDISQVDTLEIALLQVPGAERVEVKEFAGSDAVAVITLFQAVRLIDELRRVLPFQFEVANGGSDSLVLTTAGDEETGRLSDAPSDPSPSGGE